MSTAQSTRRLVEEAFPPELVSVRSYRSLLSTVAFL